VQKWSNLREREGVEFMKKRTRGRAIRFLFTLAVLCLLGGTLPLAAKADSPTSPVVDMKATIGFNGVYKWNSIVVVRINVSNRTENPIEGNVELNLNSGNEFSGTYARALSLNKGESKEVLFRVQGQFHDNVNAPDSYVAWVQNNKTLAKQPLIAEGIPDDRIFIGILANEGVTARLLATQPPEKDTAPYIEARAFTMRDIPETTLRDSGLNILVVDNEAMTRLNEAQKQTIKDWEAEGILILNANQMSEKTIWDTIQTKGKEIVPANTWYKSGIVHTLSDAAARIPSFKLPDISLATLLFVAYILIVGPILFYAMRKRRAQEWNWLFIPALSITISLAIYGYGKWQHGDKVLMQTVNLIEVQKNGDADISSATAFFAPHGGDYHLRLPKEATVFPINENQGRDVKQNARIVLHPNYTESQFAGTYFWSMRKSFAEQYQKGAGQFEATLTKQNNRVTGTLRNRTNYTLRDVRIMCREGMQAISTLAPGDSIQVSFPLRPVDRPDFLKSEFGKSLLPSSLDSKKEDSLRSPEARLIEWSYMSSDEEGIYLIGWTDQHPFKTEVMNESYQASQVSLVKAKVGEIKKTGGAK
jgi:hypothetical protein